MHLQEFFAEHPTFSTEEAAEFLRVHATGNALTRRRLLTYHHARGHVVNVRRGLYAYVPVGADAERYPVDPYLVASRMTSDAVLGYHTALELHGHAQSIHERFTYLTARKFVRVLDFRGATFHAVQQPASLRRQHAEMTGVVTLDRRGASVRVTTPERTLVDMLDRLDLSGGHEEVWQSFGGFRWIDARAVADYAVLLGNATTVARVGFFLEQHREVLDVDDASLARLRAARPKQPSRFDPHRREDDRLVSEWNLLVPARVLDREWEELV